MYCLNHNVLIEPRKLCKLIVSREERTREMLEIFRSYDLTETGHTRKRSPPTESEELTRKILKRDQNFLFAECKCFGSHSGNLSHVDIFKNEKNEEDVNKVTARPIRATLFTAFECDPNLEEEGRGKCINSTPKLFFPRPEVASSRTTPEEHTLYGSFTNVMLDIIEETHGRVTNLELAQKAMEKLKIQGIHHQKLGLDCSDHDHAFDSFVC